MPISARTRGGFAAGVLGMAVLVVASLRGRLRRFVIAEKSMAPTLDAGDFVVAARLDGLPARGDVVVYPDPLAPEMDLVKRVVGLPGETIVIENGQVHVDGAVLAEPWADGPTMPDGRWALQADEVFTLGDARAISTHDSRASGPVALSDVSWRVALRYWPLAAAGRI